MSRVAMPISVTKQNVADMAERLRSFGCWYGLRQSEREDIVLAADTLLTLAEYCSVNWPIVIERKK